MRWLSSYVLESRRLFGKIFSTKRFSLIFLQHERWSNPYSRIQMLSDSEIEWIRKWGITWFKNANAFTKSRIMIDYHFCQNKYLILLDQMKSISKGSVCCEEHTHSHTCDLSKDASRRVFWSVSKHIVLLGNWHQYLLYLIFLLQAWH